MARLGRRRRGKRNELRRSVGGAKARITLTSAANCKPFAPLEALPARCGAQVLIATWACPHCRFTVTFYLPSGD
ncbi:hypothetical protein BN2475_480031 [Paraburkholderia ribeironis]|uniref:Uncharacterized protein n=1 Tax=Paraburkholderia ribeironis TaxID=1247936 RepID=A0A1N7SBA1_9BURK|nr:hypothetical protein BN2475_480031 [Paraburkholderia ribeironis]